MMWPQVRILQAIPANIIWPINQTHPLPASLFKKNIQEVGAPGKQKNRVNFMRRRRQMSCNFTDTYERF